MPFTATDVDMSGEIELLFLICYCSLAQVMIVLFPSIISSIYLIFNRMFLDVHICTNLILITHGPC